MIEKENYDIEEIDINQIDFDKVNQVIASINENVEIEKNSMTESEKEIYESADRVVELCDKIIEERNKFADKLGKMNDTELLETYKKINQEADEYTEKLQLKAVTVEQLQNEKLNDKRDK